MVESDPKNGLTRTQAAAYVVEQVRELGLNPNPSSRLMKMHKVLNREHVPFDDPDFFIALEATRDIQHLRFVFDKAHAHCNDPKFRKVVERLLNDSVLPQQDPEKSPGRDAQFELYLAAICQNAGLLPVDYEEPDVTCTVEDTKFGIAAKRLKSRNPRQVKKHIREAADQIKKTNLPGIIAIDLSFARNQRNKPIISKLQSQWCVMIADAKNNHFFEEHELDIYRWVAGTDVLGVLVFDFTHRLLPDRRWWLDGMMCWLPTTHDDEQAKRQYASFYEGFLRGVPHLEDLTADE